MGVYTRYKRGPEGFRAIVELFETTPSSRRARMIEVGMKEDPEFTQKVLQYVMEIDDLLKLSDMEIAELMATAPARVIAYSLHPFSEETRMRFIRNAKPQIAVEVRDSLLINAGPREISGAQLKLIGTARQLERQGLIRMKKIPGT